MKFTTLTIAALSLAPAVALAQGTTSDTTTTKTTTTQTTVTSSEGRINTSHHGKKYGLSKDQVTQLQQALNDNGCNVGTPDGVVGAKTREGIACIRKQKGITSHSMSAVYSALNLDFSKGGAGAGASSANTSPSSTYPESSREAQHGRGMHDSTTSRNADTSRTSRTADTSTTTGTSTGDVSRDTVNNTRRDTSTYPTPGDSAERNRRDTSTMRRDTATQQTPVHPNPQDTAGLQVSPLDSAKMGIPPATKSDTLRVRRDTTTPPRR